MLTDYDDCFDDDYNYLLALLSKSYKSKNDKRLILFLVVAFFVLSFTTTILAVACLHHKFFVVAVVNNDADAEHAAGKKRPVSW